MPVIIPIQNVSTWLNKDIKRYSHIEELLKPYPSNFMEMWPVSNKLGDVKNNYSELTKPISKLLL